MRHRLIPLVVLFLVAAGGGAWWWFGGSSDANGPLTLYGNIDFRQTDLAFVDGGRIAEVLVEEGAEAKAGQVLARLDTGRLTLQIAQAKANVAAARAAATNARLAHERLTTLRTSAGNSIVSQSQIDTARAAMDGAAAQVEAAAAQLALLERQLTDATLTAPADGVVRSRLLEPGEIASPQRPVISLAVVNPKWARVYVAEPDLARVSPGMAATVTIDGLPDRRFTAHVGFISPVAEFTPQAIQTEELRTSLVFEVRVIIEDPDDLLRLGMPATVQLAPPAPAS